MTRHHDPILLRQVAASMVRLKAIRRERSERQPSDYFLDRLGSPNARERRLRTIAPYREAARRQRRRGQIVIRVFHVFRLDVETGRRFSGGDSAHLPTGFRWPVLPQAETLLILADRPPADLLAELLAQTTSDVATLAGTRRVRSAWFSTVIDISTGFRSASVCPRSSDATESSRLCIPGPLGDGPQDRRCAHQRRVLTLISPATACRNSAARRTGVGSMDLAMGNGRAPASGHSPEPVPAAEGVWR